MEIQKRLERLSAKKLALFARHLESRQNMPALDDEPIAIVGIGCRMPGVATGPDPFWQALRDGVDLRSEVPRERWDSRTFYDADPLSTGRSYTRHGYFLPDIDRFDPAFFGLSMREAKAMDPQHRILLEVACEAIEDAGYSLPSLAATETGVFVGIYGDDYLHLQVWSGDLDAVDGHTATGTSHSAAVGRLSHLLHLHGPSLAIDTACSSSLVAVHLACESLRRRECDTALGGGVSLSLSPEMPVTLSRAGMLSPDGRCKTFDAAADGFGRGEGAGIVMLKRLSDALASRDQVVAVVRGSAINHDGRSSTLTAPNGTSQISVLRRALQRAKLQPAEIDYIEAHGTGTPLGDPIEIKALAEVFGQRGESREPLAIGSVKTNVGHLEAAAGIAGLIKVALAMKHGVIPAHLNLRQLNPHLEIDGLPLRIATEPMPWPPGRRAAGISSFGFGGTNAHVVLAEPPVGPTRTGLDPDGRVLLVSARSESQLRELALRYAQHFANDSALDDICFTAAVGREHSTHRLAVDAQAGASVRRGLDAFLNDQPATEWRLSRATSAPRIVFLFAGQGSQHPGMGRDLYAQDTAFREALQHCDGLLKPMLGESLPELMWGEKTALLGQTAYTQPVLFAFEWALAALWRRWGVEPAAVLGHSLGEYVAACLAGVFDLEQGLRLVVERGRLMQSLPTGGAMATVMASEDQVRAAIAQANVSLSIAAVNGPRHVVVAGPREAVDQLAIRFSESDVQTHRLEVSHAFHSALMEPILDPFERIVALAAPRPPQLPLLSNLTGCIAAAELTHPQYWRRHLRETVRFAASIEAALGAGFAHFLEIGPGATLASMVQRCVPPGAAGSLPSMRPGLPARSSLLRTATELHLEGASVCWPAVHAAVPRRRVSLPTTPMQRERCWHEAARRGLQRLHDVAGRIAQPGSSHPLLGERLRLAQSGVVFSNRFDVGSPSLFSDHRLFERIVVPGASHVASLLLAARRLHPGALVVEELVFTAPLTLDEGDDREVQVRVAPVSGSEDLFEGWVWSAPPSSIHDEAGGFVMHATARLRSGCDISSAVPSHTAAEKRCAQSLDAQSFYRAMSEAGFQLGPRFQWLSDLKLGQHEAVARMRGPCCDDERSLFPLDPGFLDACFQLLAAASGSHGMTNDGESLFVPLSVDRLSLPTHSGAPASAHARLLEVSPDNLLGDISVLDEHGHLLIRVEGLRVRKIRRNVLVPAPSDSRMLSLGWRERAPLPSVINGRWLLVGDDPLAPALVEELARLGADVCRISDDATPNLNADTDTPPLAGVLYLGATSLRCSNSLSGTQLLQEQRRGTGRALKLVQRLAAEGHLRPPRLYWLTRSAVPVIDGEPVEPSQAPLWGLGRVVALEHPELWGGAVDVDSDDTSATAAAIAASLAANDGENAVAVRGGRRFVARLQPVIASAGVAPPVRTDATYLITGGLGALGLTIAKGLVEKGASTLALLGRSAPDSNTIAAIAQLENAGARVVTLQVDVADEAQLDDALARLRSTLPALRGVIHAAGVIEDALLIEQDWGRFDRVMRPKLAGAWNLHVATRGEPLDFFVLFSSAAALLGSPGQANYAAANAFLDGLAHHRRAQGQVALSLDWGPWARIGMASRGSGSGQRLMIEPFEPPDALQLFWRVLGQPEAQLGLAAVRWSAWAKSAAARPPWLSEILPPHQPRTADVQHRSASGGLALSAVALKTVPSGERKTLLAATLQAELAAVLQVAPEQIDPGRSLAAMGLDSLLSIELKHRIERGLGVALPVVTLLRGPTLHELATTIVESWDAADATVTAPVPSPNQDVAAIEHLDDAQVDALLAELTDEN